MTVPTEQKPSEETAAPAGGPIAEPAPAEKALAEPVPAVRGLVLLGTEDAPSCTDGVCS